MKIPFPQSDIRLRGGADAWDEGAAGAIQAAEFFGGEDAGASALITGTSAQAQAGQLTALAAAIASVLGTQAATADGALTALGAALAGAQGVSATALAGELAAVGQGAGVALVAGAELASILALYEQLEPSA